MSKSKLKARNRYHLKKYEKVKGQRRIPSQRVSFDIVDDAFFSQRSPRKKSQFHKRMMRLNKDRKNIPKEQKILNRKREVFPEHRDLTPDFQKKHEVGSDELGFTNKEAERLTGNRSNYHGSFSKLKQRIGRIRGMPKTNDWVYESINDPYMATEIEEHLELEYPVIKWSKGEEYAVISNKSGKPLLDNKFDVKHPPKNIEFLKEFNNAQDALDYAEYRHTDEYGGSKFQNDRYYQNLENKFKEKRYTQKRGINRNPQGEEDFEHNV